ncbi:TetR/AcrR family transcriptional regulator [Tomitella gaofuii]|uniref:TetR/AcrR family transcriptional regulator n=1 Tax=Tomitella gaofuii TaxID=2760083 RepID=UPI0015FC9759|nr:TetR/AcrR family transcriptional regulator [Tomitella gaofuii]
MTDPHVSRRRVGRPPVTSRGEILAAARHLIDRDGWDRLTMRRLASELGIGPTTLYHHVRDREELLLLLIDEYASGIPRPALPASPRERIIVAAATLHDALAAWPWAAEILTSDGFVGLLGERALWTVETIVAGAIDHGCTPDQAVHVFRHLWYHAVGEILVRAHTTRRPAPAGGAGAPTRRGAFFGDLDASRLPQLTALGDRWPALAAQDTYRIALAAIVDGLLAQGAPGPSAS